MALFQVKTEHDPGAQGTLRLKRGQLVDMQRPQPETHWQGWHWVNEDGQAGWVPELLLGRVDAQRARVLEDYDAHELLLPAGSRFVSLRQLAGWHYGHPEAEAMRLGWIPDENLEKPALQAEETPEGSLAALCSAPTGALPKFQQDRAVFLAGLGMQGDFHASPTMNYGYYKRLYGQPENWRQVLITDTAIYAHLHDQGIDLPYGSTNENIVLDGLTTKNLQIGQRIQIGEVVLEVSERRSPCSTLDKYHPGLKDAMLGYHNGEKIRDGGVLARVIRGGELRLGERVIVLSAESTLS